MPNGKFVSTGNFYNGMFDGKVCNEDSGACEEYDEGKKI